MGWPLLFLIFCFSVNANPWIRPKGELRCELSFLCSLGDHNLKSRSPGYISDAIRAALGARKKHLKKLLDADLRRFRSREWEREAYDRHEQRLANLQGPETELLKNLQRSMEHCLYSFLPCRFYTLTVEYGIQGNFGTLTRAVLSHYDRAIFKLTLDQSLKYKVTEFGKYSLVIMPIARYETSKNWHNGFFGGTLATTRSVEDVRGMKRFSTNSIGALFPLNQSYVGLETERVWGREWNALCAYFKHSAKLEIDLQRKMPPLLFAENAFGIAKNWSKCGVYLQCSVKFLAKNPFKKTRESVLKLLPDGDAKKEFTEALFKDGGLFSMITFAISCGINASF